MNSANVRKGRAARGLAALLGLVTVLSVLTPNAVAAEEAPVAVIEQTPSSGIDQIPSSATDRTLNLATVPPEMPPATTALSSTTPATETSQEMATGWIERGGARYYLLDDGRPTIGWLRHDTSWYYFGSEGAMVTGWAQLGNTWYYLESDGRMATGWRQLDSIWYYLAPSGAMATGWVQLGNTWYYLHPSGAMATGWVKTGGTWYYLDPGGVWQETGPGGKCFIINDGRSLYPTGEASRVYLVTASGYKSSYASFVSCVRQSDGSYDEAWSTSARIGGDGFNTPAQTRNGNYNDMKTPTGSFGFVSAFGVRDPGTSLSYQTLNSRSKWSGNRSWNYNRYYESNTMSSSYDENMWYFAQQGDYRQGIVLDYNYIDPNPALNYAIFLHANKVATAGCVALDEDDVTKVLKEAPPDARIIMGVTSEITR